MSALSPRPETQQSCTASPARAWRLRPGVTFRLVQPRGALLVGPGLLEQHPELALRAWQTHAHTPGWFARHFYDPHHPQATEPREAQDAAQNADSRLARKWEQPLAEVHLGPGQQRVVFSVGPKTQPQDLQLAIWQVYYDGQSSLNGLPGLQPWDNRAAQDPCLESGVLQRLYNECEPQWRQADYLGLLSHRWAVKFARNAAFRPNLLHLAGWAAAAGAEGRAVVNLWAPNARYPRVANHLTFSARFRPRLLELFALLADRLPLLKHELWRPEQVWPGNYWNAWLATPAVFRDYVDNWLEPVLSCLRNQQDAPLQQVLKSPAPYTDAHTPAEAIARQFGAAHYTHEPFVGELLFGLYCQAAGYSSCLQQIPWSPTS